ncbi:MAG: TatD family hydrolase, partial [Candidatus Babeliales bacterium]|nr:TatD family hydrolase [Candidatus Babeliales bacterium]
NDCTSSWQNDFKELQQLMKKKEIHKIVGIGETGLDRHYPDYNIKRQKDAFKAQIELSLENNVALVVHTRDARDETLRSLEEFKGQITRGIIHCYSEDQDFANQVIAWNFALGIGGTITYPKNLYLRDIVCNTSLEHMVLETDAPFLPPQTMRGKQNHPMYIKTIAEYIAQLKDESLASIAQQTTKNACRIFNLEV